MSGYYIIKEDGTVLESFNTKEAAEKFRSVRPDRDTLRIEPRGVVTFIPTIHRGEFH